MMPKLKRIEDGAGLKAERWTTVVYDPRLMLGDEFPMDCLAHAGRKDAHAVELTGVGAKGTPDRSPTGGRVQK
jgi:hypothetical protein